MSTVQLHVATLNILNLADRWAERLPLLLADMAALQPDVLALQEVVYVLEQDRLIGAAGPGHYAAMRGWAGRREYGNCILVREPLAAGDAERVDLGRQRAAHRTAVEVANSLRVGVTVTHLHHLEREPEVRLGQVQQLVGWLDERALAVEVVMGDFNAHPGEPAYARMAAEGFRSASVEANGAEPDVTWPSGLRAPAKDADGTPRCIDYVWVRGDVRVESCRLVFDRPAVDDPTLYPSDHFGLAARLVVRGAT
jgi:endonuclease/exonuclease/phosphatase family metal-dependent hydrolase